MLFRKFLFTLFYSCLISLPFILSGCSDSDNNSQAPAAAPESSGANVAIAVDPYIVNAQFEELSADGETVLQASSTLSDQQGRFTFPNDILYGSILQLKATSSPTHGGFPFQGMLKRRILPGELPPFIVSPLSTMLANGITRDELISFLADAGLTGLTEEDLLRDPMLTLTDRGGAFTDHELLLLQANMAIAAYMEATGDFDYAGSPNTLDATRLYFADVVALVQESLQGSFYQKLVVEIGDGFILDDLINTSITLNRDIVRKLRQELTKGEVLSAAAVAGLSQESLSSAVNVAWDVFLERTQQERPPVDPIPEPVPEPVPEPEPEPEPEPQPGPSQLPVAVNDADSATEGDTGQISGNLLENDTLGEAPTTITALVQNGFTTYVGRDFKTSAQGTMEISADGDYFYIAPGVGDVPPEGVTETFDYTITDAEGHASSASLVVTVVNNNQSPSAVDDILTVTEGDAASIGNLLSNDDLGDGPTVLTAADQNGHIITLGSAFETSEGGSITLETDGSYSYTPPEFGVDGEGLTEVFNHTITDTDGDISEAIFTITVKDNGRPLPRSLKYSAPTRLAGAVIDNESMVIVSSYDSGQVGVINLKSMRIEQSLRVAGKPTGVVFAFDRFYVGTRAGKVEVFDRNGNRLYFLGGEDAFDQVNDLAVDEDAGLLYILDSKNAWIRVFSHNGSDSGHTIGAGVLRQPAALTVDAITGYLIVSEYGAPGGSARLRVFNSSGNELPSIAGSTPGGGGMFGGGGETFFSTPQGLHADGFGNLYVTDARSGEIQVYEIDTGTQLYTLGSLGTGSEELFYPLDVYVDQLTRDVYVADQGNNRILVFREGGAVQ